MRGAGLPRPGAEVRWSELPVPAGYLLDGQYRRVVSMVRAEAPHGLEEAIGVVQFSGIPDFRLNLGRYRVVEIAPMARRVAVFMEWRKVLRDPARWEREPQFDRFIDAFGYLGINDNWNQPWNITLTTDLDEAYVADFLASGMWLMVNDIRRRHPSPTAK